MSDYVSDYLQEMLFRLDLLAVKRELTEILGYSPW